MLFTEEKERSIRISKKSTTSSLTFNCLSAKFFFNIARNNSSSGISISITGIAGPDGGSEDKPVGLVYFGLAQTGSKTQKFKHNFTGIRSDIQLQAVETAFKHLIDAIN